MRRKLHIVFAVFVCLAFPLRDALCWCLYPSMKTEAGEWDGSNNLTMDLFAWMFFCLAFIAWDNTKGVLSVILGIALGFSIGDVLDRLFNVREYTGGDYISVPLAIFIPIYTYVYSRKKVVN